MGRKLRTGYDRRVLRTAMAEGDLPCIRRPDGVLVEENLAGDECYEPAIPPPPDGKWQETHDLAEPEKRLPKKGEPHIEAGGPHKGCVIIADHDYVAVVCHILRPKPEEPKADLDDTFAGEGVAFPVGSWIEFFTTDPGYWPQGDVNQVVSKKEFDGRRPGAYPLILGNVAYRSRNGYLCQHTAKHFRVAAKQLKAQTETA